MRRGYFSAGCFCRRDTHPLGLPSLCGILMETAFSNVDWRTSSVALKARLFTTRVLLAWLNAVETSRKSQLENCFDWTVGSVDFTPTVFQMVCNVPAAFPPFWLFSPTKSTMMDLPCTSIPWASSSIFSASASDLNSM